MMSFAAVFIALVIVGEIHGQKGRFPLNIRRQRKKHKSENKRSSNFKYGEKGFQSFDATLESYLLSGVNRIVRPVVDLRTPINVTLGINIHQVVEVEETANLITCQYWVREVWTNELLRWDPSEWNDKKVVSINAKRIWTPDIVLYNDADESLSGRGMRESSYIKVYPNGLNVWEYSITYKSTCLIQVMYYPFDYQTCKLKFGSWVYDNSLLVLKQADSQLIVADYINSTEWSIEYVNIAKSSQVYANYGDKAYDDLTLTFVIKRNWASQVFVLLGPSLLMLVTTLFSFSIPPNCSERITVIVTNLVAFAVSFDMTSQSLPKNSDSVSAISKAYNVLFVESTVSLFVACCILRVYHKGTGPNPPPVPGVIRKALFNVYAGKYESNLKGLATLPFINEILGKRNINETSIAPLLPSLFERGEAFAQTISKLENIISMSSEEEIESETLKQIKAELEIVTAFMANHMRKIKVQNEWRLLGNILDWTYFTLFFIFVVSTTTYIILWTLMESKAMNERHLGGGHY